MASASGKEGRATTPKNRVGEVVPVTLETVTLPLVNSIVHFNYEGERRTGRLLTIGPSGATIKIVENNVRE